MKPLLLLAKGAVILLAAFSAAALAWNTVHGAYRLPDDLTKILILGAFVLAGVTLTRRMITGKSAQAAAGRSARWRQLNEKLDAFGPSWRYRVFLLAIPAAICACTAAAITFLLAVGLATEGVPNWSPLAMAIASLLTLFPGVPLAAFAGLAAFGIYFLPTLIVIKRRRPNFWGIFVVNLAGSLIFGIGWIIALIWACSAPFRPEIINAGPGYQPASATPISSQLTELARLRDSGAITEAEFQAQKARLMA